jgi:hypothetical protein
MKLNYVIPNTGRAVQAAGHANPESNIWTDWLHHMIAANPDTIFFYTTETTDIFEDEPKCICLETGSHACGGVDRCWCAPACPVCFPEEVKDEEEALNDYLNLKGRQ